MEGSLAVSVCAFALNFTVTLPVIYPEDVPPQVQNTGCVGLFTAALFVIQKWKQPRCPPRMSEPRYINLTENCAAAKIKEEDSYELVESYF